MGFDLKVNNWPKLLEFLEDFSIKYALDWHVDQRCACKVLSEFETLELDQQDYLEYVDKSMTKPAGNMAYLNIHDLPGVEIVYK